MNKGKLYMLTMFALSLGVVFGGWFVTKAILNRQMEELLKNMGHVPVQSTETALFTEEGRKEAAGEPSGQSVVQKEELTEELMKEILAVWESGGGELPHEPKKGQINMEQAIATGKAWIDVLAQQRIIPEELTEGDFDKVSAKLCTRKAETDMDESLISYWSVEYTRRDVCIHLIIHAVSAQVWKADISMNESADLSKDYSREELLDMAFPFLERGGSLVEDLTNNVFYVSSEKELVFAAVSMQKIREDEGVPVLKIELWLEEANRY